MALVEFKELKEQLKDLLDKGFIWTGISLWGAPILFVKKKDISLLMCIHRQQLKEVSTKKEYPFPRIYELYE